jgi:hypothetical protein
MRRVMILMVSVLTIVTMALSPAFAGDWDGDGWDEEFGFWILVPLFVEVDVDDDFCDWYDCGDWDHGDWDDCDDDHGWDDCDDDHDWEGPVHLID